MTNEYAFRVFSSGTYTLILMGPLAARPAPGTAPCKYIPENRNYTIIYVDEDTLKPYTLKRNADTGLATSWTT